MRRLIFLTLFLTIFFTASTASAGACANLCDGSTMNPPQDYSYPQGQTVWEKSDVCTDPRLQVVGEPGQPVCLPDDSWWPAVRVTCLVNGQPIAEFQNPGTTGWIGASLCPPAIFEAPVKPEPPSAPTFQAITSP